MSSVLEDKLAVDLTFKDIDDATKLDMEKELSFSTQIRELFSWHYIKYIFLPIEDRRLKMRDFILNRQKSKRSFLRRIRNPLTILGFLILVMLATWGVHGHWISYIRLSTLEKPYIPRPNFQPPSERHWLGTQLFSHDVFGLMIFGVRISLTIGLSAIFIGVFFGTVLGTLVAYQGGILDSIVMRIVDVIMAFPSLILMILVVSLAGASGEEDARNIQTVLAVMGILSIPGYARLMRGTVLQEKGRIYVDAAKVSGASSMRVMFRHVLPNAITPILISLSFRIGTMTLSLAALSYIGYGVDEEIEWGYELNLNQARLADKPWATIWPGVAIMIAVLGFMLFGDGVRDALDPRSKA